MSLEEDYIAAKLAGRLPGRQFIRRSVPRTGLSPSEILKFLRDHSVLTFEDYKEWREDKIKINEFRNGNLSYNESEDYLITKQV